MRYSNIYVISDQNDLVHDLCFGAKKLGDKVTAVVFGTLETAQSVTTCGADQVVYCSNTAAPEDYSKALAETISANGSALVMVSNSIRGRMLAGKIGVYLDTAVLSNVNAMAMEGDALVCKRTVYGGAAVRGETFTAPYAVVTLSSGVFGDIDATYPATADVVEFAGAATAGSPCIARNEKKEGGTNLAAAKRIVDVGRGLAAEADLEMMRNLASLIEAEVGCSRPVAENNKWMPKANYMGVTGVVVKPDLCFSIGVSGQVQHIAGIDKSKVIVAVNKDKNAPIFKHADFGIVGDLYKVIPALMAKLG